MSTLAVVEDSSFVVGVLSVYVVACTATVLGGFVTVTDVDSTVGFLKVAVEVVPVVATGLVVADVVFVVDVVVEVDEVSVTVVGVVNFTVGVVALVDVAAGVLDVVVSVEVVICLGDDVFNGTDNVVVEVDDSLVGVLVDLSVVVVVVVAVVLTTGGVTDWVGRVGVGDVAVDVDCLVVVTSVVTTVTIIFVL